MSQNVLLTDIPITGQRYDMTLDAVGFSSGEDKKLVARFIIDRGRYKGKRVTTVLGCNDPDLYGFTPVNVKRLRVSAVLHVTADAFVDGRWIRVKNPNMLPPGVKDAAFRYSLTDFAPAEGESELGRLLGRTEKFVRK